MVVIRSAALTIAFLLGVALAAPLEAQTSARLNVTARVVQECTVTAKSKRELVKLARKLRDPSIISRCSKGVVSRVDRQRVKVANLQPRTALPRTISRKRVDRSTIKGQTDVVLVTVTY